jgi:dethiobiotin synthetase
VSFSDDLGGLFPLGGEFGAKILIVTGTDTGVGKTIVTAALAARGLAAGLRVAVLKPAQTGTAEFAPGFETADVDTVARLVGPDVTCVTLAEYPDPLAPLAAAQVSGLAELYLADVLEATAKLVEQHDLVIIEGAGGVLVPMGFGGWTVADLAVALRAPAVVVARAGLGTLNHTALTLEALAARGIEAAVVIGAWPAEPELVHERNRIDLPGTIIGVIPENVGRLDRAEFRVRSPGWFTAG